MGMLSLSEAIDYIAAYFVEMRLKYRISLCYRDQDPYSKVDFWEIQIDVLEKNNTNELSYSFHSVEPVRSPDDELLVIKKLDLWFRTIFGPGLDDLARIYGGEDTVSEEGD